MGPTSFGKQGEFNKNITAYRYFYHFYYNTARPEWQQIFWNNAALPSFPLRGRENEKAGRKLFTQSFRLLFLSDRVQFRGFASSEKSSASVSSSATPVTSMPFRSWKSFTLCSVPSA